MNAPFRGNVAGIQNDPLPGQLVGMLFATSYNTGKNDIAMPEEPEF